MLNDPPPFLFKYCTSQIYKEFLREGHLRLRDHKYFRQEFEEYGAGYGDGMEGISRTHVRRQTVDIEVPSYFFCLANSYSKESHIKWFRRPRCDYNLCIKLNGPELVASFRRELVRRFGNREQFVVGGIQYDQRENLHSPVAKTDLSTAGMHKRAGFSWEDEYRLAVRKSEITDCGDFFDIQLPDIGQLITNEIELPKSF